MLEWLLLSRLPRPLTFERPVSAASEPLFSKAPELRRVPQPHLSVRLLSLLQLVGELSALSDVLSGTRAWAEEAAIRTSYTNLGFSIWKGVQIAVKVRPDGRRFLLAVNASWDPAEPTWFDLPAGVMALRPVDASSAGQERGSAEAIRVEDFGGAGRGAGDRFGPFEVRVYEMLEGETAKM